MCVSCRETYEYEHRMNEDPDRCSNCNSNIGLVKQLSAPNIGKSNSGGFDKGKYISMGIATDNNTGEVFPVGTTRELRKDGSPFVDASAVNLITGQKVNMPNTLIGKSD